MTTLAFPKPTRLDRRERKRFERETRAARVARIRDDVLARSLHKCEAPDCRAGGRELHLDHWLGGIGRRRQAESAQTTWMLCAPSKYGMGCHHAKTYNLPSAKFWQDQFKAHCERHGYPFPAAHAIRRGG